MRIIDRPEFKNKPPALTCKGNLTLREAAKLMAEKNYGSIVVVDGSNKVKGLITERDYVNRIVAEGIDPDKTKISEIMTPDPRMAQAEDDLIDWLRIMSNERFRRLPVVDENGQLINVVTQGDFVSYTWPDLISQAKTFVRDTATKNRQILFVAAGVIIYTLLVLIAVRSL